MYNKLFVASLALLLAGCSTETLVVELPSTTPIITTPNTPAVIVLTPSDNIQKVKIMTADNRCLAIKDGKTLVVDRCKDSDAQLFSYQAQKIRTYNGKCLDVAGARTDNGAPVIAYTCMDNKHNQLFYKDGNALKSMQTHKCLDRRTSAWQEGIAMQTCSSSRAQAFSISPAP
mgnify:FL=1